LTALIGVLAIVLGVVGLFALFLRTDPARLAGMIRLAGPVALGIVGVVLLLLGRAGLGGLVLSGAAGLYGYLRRSAPVRQDQGSGGRRSSVRTAALEMELEHDTGKLDGLVLAGRHEQRNLRDMKLAELLDLRSELSADFESLQLLETYLDGRFPVWRKDANADDRNGQGVAPGAGAMTKQEAYKVLGLEAGASAADIRKAHRRLMQRLHPDLGGSSFLAARINEAKDILLTDHD